MTKEDIDKIKLEDIELFARRYVELFSKYFNKNTSQEQQQFYEEIKQELTEKCTEYRIDESHPFGTNATFGYVIFENENHFFNQEVRIHELVHAYNSRNGMNGGLKDFEKDIVLKDFDEGSTELIARKLLGQSDEKDTAYEREVSMVRIIEAIVGEENLVKSMRFGPQLLCESVDNVLGTNNLILEIENNSREINTQQLKVDNDENFIENMLIRISCAQLETLPTLFDAINKSNDIELIERVKQICEKFGYENYLKMFEIEKLPTIADKQQKFLLQDIEKLENKTESNLVDKFRLEIKKHIYDKIDFQRTFLGVKHEKKGYHILSDEEKSQSEGFKSKLDGKERNLHGFGGQLFFGDFITRMELGIYKPVDYDRVYIDAGSVQKPEYIAKRMNLAYEEKSIAYWYNTLYLDFCKEHNIIFNSDEFPYDETKETLFSGLRKEREQLIERQRNMIYDRQVKQYDAQIEEKDEELSNLTIETAETWLERLSRCNSISDKLPKNLKDEFIKIKFNVINAIKRKKKEKTSRDSDFDNKKGQEEK